MALKLQLSLALALTVLAASLRTGHSCNSGNRGGSGSESITDSGSGRPVRVSGYVLLNPAPQQLPVNTRLEVRLQDISLMDAPSKLLGSQTLNSVSTSYNADRRIPFSLEAVIPADTPFMPHSVSVSASLRGDGVSYITDTAYYVNLQEGTFEYRDMEITIIKYP
ncbi:hypothetical protein BOX15_Mlig025402g1 [Macrostomum lignano]|uniref:Uncharacterized protein n=1 Tax=Macrostomum lignano TaxID=282301 RepID=A0A267ET10_9PLAT|nr:hypothetical protein BOX15_Mlig025402g1 [Macrostomum lignano]